MCRALSSNNADFKGASRPWDKGRDGFVMGEGAGVLVMESLEHAQERGATIICEYMGGAITCDAHHMTDPRADGLGAPSLSPFLPPLACMCLSTCRQMWWHDQSL